MTYIWISQELTNVLCKKDVQTCNIPGENARMPVGVLERRSDADAVGKRGRALSSHLRDLPNGMEERERAWLIEMCKPTVGTWQNLKDARW